MLGERAELEAGSLGAVQDGVFLFLGCVFVQALDQMVHFVGSGEGLVE